MVKIYGKVEEANGTAPRRSGQKRLPRGSDFETEAFVMQIEELEEEGKTKTKVDREP